ncbi:hypothetical protein [Clostridium botulinum]|uniref:hypothetical protein n=1 Tax=Clostridium botulinum TaxID=1491 RepID=UPI000773DF50|nr:hypothetical protein [Clostridium botulinum]
MIELKFYFKLGKELKMAIDEDGNYGEVYSCCTLTVEKAPTDEQMQKLEEGYKKAIVGQVKGELKYITPISKEEYEENVDEY